jgi:hypothetical protein
MLRDIDKKNSKQINSRPFDTLKYSGLKKVKGKTGEYLWVSPVAVETFRQYGYDVSKEKFRVEKFREFKINAHKEAIENT